MTSTQTKYQKSSMTDKRHCFVREYIIDFNGTQAAIRAGFSKKTARKIASNLLANEEIQTGIQAEIERRNQRIEVSQDMVIDELRKLAFSNMRHFASWGPDGVKIKDSTEIDRDQAVCVAEVYETTTEHGGTVRFKLHDKLKALELLGRHLGLFPNRTELTSKDSDPLTPVLPPSVEVYLLARKKALKMF